MLRTDTMIDSAGRWFIESGIQEPHGGVARYYRSDLEKNANVSTEITGYAASALLFLYERTQNVKYLEAGLKAARFLTRTAWDSQLGAFPFEYALNGTADAYTYFFDCGIIVRGLLAAWWTTGEAEFRDAAVAGGRSMLRDFCGKDAIHPILSLPAKNPVPYQPRWSASPGCYQLKSAMAWFELHEVTGEAEFLTAYQHALEAAMSSERRFLPGDANCEKVMDRLHAYAYFLEGLLPALGRSECALAFSAGVDRMAGLLREIAPQFVRSDVCAQLLRVRLLGDRLGVSPLDWDAAAYEADRTAAFHLESQDPRIAGGFGFGSKFDQPLPYVNPVSTTFAVQALAFWSDSENNAFQAPPRSLI